MLPPETLELIFGYVDRGDLLVVLVANAALHYVAARVLYRVLVDIPARRTPRLLRTLAHNNVYAPLVRRLDLDWTDNHLTANLLRLLHRALSRLSHLRALALDFAPDANTSLAWILPHHAFSLYAFSTSMRCDAPLARFLAAQPTLVELGLRGVPTGFVLPPDALPRLAQFRSSRPGDVAGVLAGRPVERVSLALALGGGGSAQLDALRLSASVVRRLTVVVSLDPFALDADADPADADAAHPDPTSPKALLAAIAARTPALHALHVIVVPRRASLGDLLEAAPSLSPFTALRYLTYITSGVDLPNANQGEATVATAWAAACPTLRTIILPRGVMWGSVDGRWVALHDPPPCA